MYIFQTSSLGRPFEAIDDGNKPLLIHHISEVEEEQNTLEFDGSQRSVATFKEIPNAVTDANVCNKQQTSVLKEIA